MFKVKTLAAILLSFGAFGAAHATTPASANALTVKIPHVLESLSKQGAGLEVIKNFEAKGGLDGWVVKDGESGKFVVVYTTKDGEVMIAGLAIDSKGENLSAAYSEQHLPTPDYSAAFEDFSQKSSNVVLGNPDAPAEITVAYDVNCGFCKMFHKLVTPAIEAGNLKLRIVPVAILGGDSGPKGAGLLATDDLKGSMQAASYGLGTVARSNEPALLAKVQANTQMMRKHGFNGTPLVLYEIKKGDEKTVMVTNGVPDVKVMFKELGIDGNLDKLRDDPSLARFLQ